MDGYYKEPQATAAVMTNGWLHTGDMAVWDEENYIHIVDRHPFHLVPRDDGDGRAGSPGFFQNCFDCPLQLQKGFWPPLNVRPETIVQGQDQ